jgi:hypothetical protein
MAASSSDAPTGAIPIAAIPTAIPTLPAPNLTFHEKLEGPNYLSWLTQFLPILRSTQTLWQSLMDPSHAHPSFWLMTVISTQS